MFGVYRLKGGSYNNPDVLQVFQRRSTVHVQNEVAPKRKRGNTEVEVEEQLQIESIREAKRPRKL